MTTTEKRVSVALYLDLTLSDGKIVNKYIERDGMEILPYPAELTFEEEELVFAEIDRVRAL